MLRNCFFMMFSLVLALSFLFPARLPAPSTTTVGVSTYEGALNQDMGAQIHWEGCNCTVSENTFSIGMGQTLPAHVADPAKLAHQGIPGTKKGDALTITWEGEDKWIVKHVASGRSIVYHYKIPVSKARQ
ncbi:MAG: hypothetical protein ABIJ31_13705 [Pseudomonadota bacterium]